MLIGINDMNIVIVFLYFCALTIYCFACIIKASLKDSIWIAEVENTKVYHDSHKVTVKEELHLQPKLSMFCVLCQNFSTLFDKKIWASWSKLSEKLKNGTSGSWVINQNMQNIVYINYSRTVWPITQELLGQLLKNCLAYWNFNTTFEFLRQCASFFFTNWVDNFEIAHQNAQLVWGVVAHIRHAWLLSAHVFFKPLS